MFNFVLAAFAVFAVMTLLTEYRRAGGATPLSMLTVGNGLYSVLTPAISYYSPESTPIFRGYVEEAGAYVDDAGLVRVLAAAAVFQLVCCVVALCGGRFAYKRKEQAYGQNEYLSAAIAVGWVLMLIGVIGVVGLGLSYNEKVFGLYQIAYAERSPFFRDHGGYAFLLLLGMYGASQLIATYILTGHVRRAFVILLLVMLHGIGVKSKFPIFWILVVFFSAALGGRINMRKLMIPFFGGILILFSMSVFRAVVDAQGLDDYIEASQESSVHYWENDIPGPASITYFLMNDIDLEYTITPLLEVPKLLVPRFFSDRGDVLPEIWAAKMLGYDYEVGMGYGWSLLCDGYLLGGLAGVAFLAYLMAKVARLIRDVAGNCDGRDRVYRFVVMYACMPLFLLGLRESFAGLIKALIIIAVMVWIPTVLIARRKRLQGVRGGLS